ncbi:VCP-like ATPase [ANME-1 cluster archaeon GoMg2]|nr:VCP-like ATPase [ANME-1 cluster archaeon GoMg2]
MVLSVTGRRICSHNMTIYYETNLQHIAEELKRVDLLIQLQVLKIRCKKEEGDGFQGLYVSEEEINTILEDTPPVNEDEDQHIQTLIERIAELEQEIEAKKVESLGRGITLTLPLLANIFGLTPLEIDVVLICMAPELDTKYERLYAYLHNDATKKQPSVNLVLSLLCNTKEEMLYARQIFDVSAPLVKYHILQFIDAPEDGKKTLLSRFIKVDDRIINYLLGFNLIDTKIEPFTELIQPQTDLEAIFLPEELKREIAGIINCRELTDGTNCFLYGPYGVGKKTVAQSMCKELGMALLTVDIAYLVNTDADFEAVISRSFREAKLQDSAIFLAHFERLYSEDTKNVLHKKILFNALENCSGIVFIASEQPLELGGAWQTFDIQIPIPDYAMRKTIWEQYLTGTNSEEDVSALANKFKFTAGQIKDAIVSARKLAVLQGREDIALEDLYDGCRAQSNQKLTALAKRIKPKYHWDDLILPKEKKEQLEEVKNYIKNKGVVYHDWGFDDKLSLGKGLNILFSGTSGTGKTRAAEVIASELGLDLYKIDLSMVVSKYIGETEKNLNRIFKEAEQSNAILFFDEADALFGKRSEVRDSHDRYANIEISYLLQKMEENEGIVIMATNLSQNIDDAFMRRMHFNVEFPFPEEEYRYKIWRSLIPKEAPIADDIEFEFLAKRFKLAGGNIKNIVVNAAFLAAEESGVIRMEHVIKAAKREFQKIGKVCSQSEFGKYYGVVCK